MIQLVQIYVKSDGIERNISEAIRIYQIAITFNDQFAMVQLAQIYVKGDDIERNMPEAIRLYQIAVKLNNTHAINHFA
jgi:TPR repeat protein